MVLFTYKVARASEYLAITGNGKFDVKLAKRARIMPSQTCTVFDICPVNYTLEVQAMSAEKLPFLLPAVFTIGPRHNDQESLLKYAKFISPHGKLSRHVRDLIHGVIEGEIRVLAASMTMDEVLKGTKELEEKVLEKVQLDLNQIGLLIYNADLRQLVEAVEAANQVKVDTAETRMHEEIGVKERDGMTKQNAAKIDAETKVKSTQREGEGKKEEDKVKTDVKIFKNRREAEVTETNAEMKKADWARQPQVAEVEANKVIAIKEVELQMEVESKNKINQTEKLKAEILSKVVVDDEIKVSEVDKQKDAEAALYEQEKEALKQTEKLKAEMLSKAVDHDMKVPEFEKQKAAEATPPHNTSKRRKSKGANRKRRLRYTKQKEDGMTRQNAVKIDAETKVYSTQRKGKGKGKAEEVKVKTDVITFPNRMQAEVAELDTQSQVVQVEAETKVYSTQKKGDGKAGEIKVKMDVKTFHNWMEHHRGSTHVVMQDRQSQVMQVEALEITEVQHQNALKEIERLKAEKLSNIEVEHQMEIKEEDLLCQRKKKAAEASRFEKQQEADAASYVHQKKVEAENDAKKKKAEGLSARGAVYGRAVLDVFEGILRILKTCNGILSCVVNEIWPVLRIVHVAIV